MLISSFSLTQGGSCVEVRPEFRVGVMLQRRGEDPGDSGGAADGDHVPGHDDAVQHLPEVAGAAAAVPP